MNQLQPSLKLLFFPILYMGTFFRALKYWPYTASNSFHHFLTNNNTNSRFPRRYKIRGDAVYWFVLQTSLKMAKIPIFALFFHCFRVLFRRPSPFRALDTIVTDRKIAEKSINCRLFFISRFPQTLKLSKYKILKRTMGLQTGYLKNTAEAYLSEMTRRAPVTLLLFLYARLQTGRIMVFSYML